MCLCSLSTTFSTVYKRTWVLWSIFSNTTSNALIKLRVKHAAYYLGLRAKFLEKNMLLIYKITFFSEKNKKRAKRQNKGKIYDRKEIIITLILNLWCDKIEFFFRKKKGRMKAKFWPEKKSLLLSYQISYLTKLHFFFRKEQKKGKKAE